MPFDWKGRASGEGRLERQDGRLTFTTIVGSDDLVLSGVPMGRLRGRFELLPEAGGRLEAGLLKPGRPAESLILTFRDGRVEVGRADLVDPSSRDRHPGQSGRWREDVQLRPQLPGTEFLDESLDRRGTRSPSARSGRRRLAAFCHRRPASCQAGRFGACRDRSQGHGRPDREVSDVNHREFISLARENFLWRDPRPRLRRCPAQRTVRLPDGLDQVHLVAGGL
jgi:hypothetical protein